MHDTLLTLLGFGLAAAFYIALCVLIALVDHRHERRLLEDTRQVRAVFGDITQRLTLPSRKSLNGKSKRNAHT